MGMGQQDGSDRFWIEAQIPILTKRLLSAPLKEPTIQQQSASGRFNHVADQPGIFVPPTMLVLSSQAGWFRERGLAPETAVRTNRVVVAPPTFRHDLRFLERVEQLAVEKLRPHLAIE